MEVYLSQKVLEKAKGKEFKEERAWNGRSGIYFISGELGTNIHVVKLDKDENGKLNVFCSCLAFTQRRLCSHIFTVYLHLMWMNPSLAEELKAWVEEWVKAKKERAGKENE